MAFALKGSASKELDGLLDAFNETRDALDTAIGVFNAALAELRPPVDAAQEAFNEAVAALIEHVGEFVASMREQYDAKSERWQDGDKGRSVNEWIDAWQDWLGALDPVDLPENEELDDSLPDDPRDTLPPEVPDGE